ncbi:hypothetical protein J1N35_004785 [Gossypium stocksii]|uniref:Uncharacterized protein n=1 Tax=Gossypium stocksii TaxID=47602 RepID=A0A9D4AIM8_9ROSI|nr:hypothetical protein J1N35_004785 [Gossypium stocksii]
MLLALERRVINLEESMGDMRDTIKVVEGHTDKLDSMKEKLREFVLESLYSNVEAMQRMFYSTMDKLKVRDDALDSTVMALNE